MSNARIVELHAGPCSLVAHGQKATLLSRAIALGEQVPAGFVLAADEVAAFVAGQHDAELAAALARLGDERVAVRSSPTLSLPGALATELDVAAELGAVRAAIQRVLASTGARAAVDQLGARGLETPHAPWCAVLIQAYVAARSDDAMGLVVCTRDPNTGERGPVGEYVRHAGAEDVVSGRSRPRSVRARRGETDALELSDAALYTRLSALSARLETAFEEPLELEIVHRDGVSWLLQVRPLVLSARAQASLALEAMADDSPRYRPLLRRVIDEALPQLVEARLPAPERVGAERLIARGLAASPGVGRGALVIDLDTALQRARTEPVVLARRDAVPEDVAAFRAARAIVTTSGGLTSHAAVIARGLRVPAVVGAGQVRVDVKQRCLVDGLDPTRVLAREGEQVTVDAHRGLVYRGEVAPEPAVAAPELAQLLVAARKLRRAGAWVRAPFAQALALRATFELDGSIASWTGELPPRDSERPGKDCWIELPAERAVELAPELPAGFGILLVGTADDACIRAVRAVARMRPIGVEVRGEPTLSEAIDLAVAPSGASVSQLAIVGPKRVVRVDAETDFDAPGHEAAGAFACDASKALRFALGLASLGRS